MHPLNDKDLDRLSREAAEQYDVGSSATGWDLVENRLNAEMPVKAEKEKRRFLFWLFFIALMAGGGLVYMLGGSKSNTSIAQSRESGTVTTPGVSQPAANTQPAAGTTSKAVSSQTDKNSKDISTTNPIVNPSTKGSNGTVSSKTIVDKVSGSTDNRNSIVSVKRSNYNIKNKNTTLLLSDKAVVTRGQKEKPVSKQNNPVTKGQVDVADTDPVVTINNNSGKNKAVENKVEEVDNTKSNIPAVENATVKKENTDNTEKADKKTPELTASAKKPISKTHTPIKAPLEFGVVVGPDQSSVKFKTGDNTGINYGVQVGYRFSNRWSVNTGIILEKKNYIADGSDFTPPEHHWTSYVKMNSIDGSCKMYDIPLNVRYDLSYNDKRRFFVSTGLTTYLMRHQAYEYYYTNPLTGQDLEKPGGTDSSMNYLFSVLNLSVGYERALGKHFSLQAEPYLKIPLKGVGFGSMKLDSYGIYFSLKYKPDLSKKKK